MLTAYIEGRISYWDAEAAFSAWEKMKTLYSESNGEGEQQEIELVMPNRSELSGLRDGASGSGATNEKVIVEDVVE